MNRPWLPLMLLALTALSACGSTGGASSAAPPPLAAGLARFYFYRDPAAPYVSPAWTRVALNGQAVGDSAPGSAFYRDVAPGTYRIEVRSDQVYPDQFRSVAAAAGSTTFVKVQELPQWGLTAWGPRGQAFVVQIVSPAQGAREIAGLPLTPG